MLKLGWGTVNLEARAAGSPFNWSFTGTATPEQDAMPVPRGRVLGGSSAINGQTFIRGAPEDYDTWESWGNDGWGYVDCLPYFRRLENDADFHDDFHGTDGPVPCGITSARPGRRPRRLSSRPPPEPVTRSIPT